MRQLGLICFFLLAANVLLQCIGLLQFRLGADQIPETVNNYIYIGCIIAGLTIGALWNKIVARKQSWKGLLWIIQPAVRLLLAFVISSYGFAKIFHQQFSVPENIKDIPIGELSGFWLTWYYFGYSYTFSLIIALGQIGGALLLLFNRTRLLGTFILLPIMLNIVFINVYYEINFGAFLNSLIYTSGIVYLLLLNYNELKGIFFSQTESANTINRSRILKNSLKVLAPLLALGSTLLTTYSFDNNSILKGVYVTESIVKNNQALDIRCKTDSILTKMYFDYKNLAVLEYQSHYKRSYNSYDIDAGKKIISLYFSDTNQTDTLRADIGDMLTLDFFGKIGNDSVRVNLKKVR